MLVLLVIVVLIILSLMFGGFQKGTKSGGFGPLGPGPLVAVCAVCTSSRLRRALVRRRASTARLRRPHNQTARARRVLASTPLGSVGTGSRI